MQLQVTFRHVEPSEAIKEYAREKISKIQKFLDGSMEAGITLSVEKHRHEADVVIIAKGFKIHGKEITGDLYSAIDLVIDKLEAQVKKYREKLKKVGRHRRGQDLPMQVDVFEADSIVAEENPKIIKSKTMVAQSMSVDEAAMQLEFNQAQFFIFINAETDKFNVIYLRQDGNFGLVVPEQQR